MPLALYRCETEAMNKPAQVWNQRYLAQPLAVDDAWLWQWQSLLPHPSGGQALDLGCGDGHETGALLTLDWQVTAVDISEQALARCKAKHPQAHALLADARDLSPLPAHRFALVIAHLSLHYFDRADTLKAFTGLQRLLTPSGLLLGSVNAEDDFNYGAPLDASAWNTVLVDGLPKQFFTEAKLREALGPGFEILQLNKCQSLRFGAAKSVWDFAARPRV